MLRRILGPVCVEGQWRSCYNDELYEIYDDLTVVQRMHVVRIATDDPARKVLLGRPQGQSGRGRPKLRWQDGVEASGIRAWDNGLADEGARPQLLRHRVSDTPEAGQDRTKAVVAPDK